MRLYVAGPMTGLPDFNYPAFFDAADRLDRGGFTVGNPAADGQVLGWSWEQYLRRALRLMLECDGVAILDGWERSRGARLEAEVAAQLGMRVDTVKGWLTPDLAVRAGRQTVS